MKTAQDIKAELARIAAALMASGRNPVKRHEFLAVQQALAWALDLHDGDVLSPFEYVSLCEEEAFEWPDASLHSLRSPPLRRTKDPAT